MKEIRLKDNNMYDFIYLQSKISAVKQTGVLSFISEENNYTLILHC